MTPRQVSLVQESFALVSPIREEAATLFYSRLFQLDPLTQKLFSMADMKKQGGMLMAAISFVVHALDRPEAMITAVKGLGRRHATYGVEERHYDTVGAALLWTLAAGLGDRFTAEMRDAWSAAYTMLSEAMIGAARQAAFEQAA